MKILYTGFEPFGGECTNPSFEAIRLLPGKIAGAEVIRLEIPVVFGKAEEAVLRAVETHRPEFVICVGQAGGRAAVTPEYAAINYRCARIPDNAGQQPFDERIIPGGPAAYFTKLPVHEIVRKCVERGIPAAVSYSAGTFVCNEVMYTLLHAVESRFPHLIGGFLHVPYSPEQAAVKTPVPPCMDLHKIADALFFAGEVSICVQH